MTIFQKISDLQALVEEEIGLGGWFAVDQQRIDLFAHATGDRQWIHTDPVRAAEGPFGTTVAHGFLTLSMLPELSASAFTVTDARVVVNYGLNRVRFPAPLASGSRLRGRFRLLAYEPLEGGAQITLQATMEGEGLAKPVCVAEWIVRMYC